MSAVMKKSKARKKLVLIKEKLLLAIKGTPAEGLERMLDTPLYSFRVLKYMYEINELSPAGFLNNDNIYDLRLGKISGKGDILMRSGIMELFSRFGMANSFAEQGDALTAFFIDNDDKFYEYFIEKMSNGTEDVTQDAYTMEFNGAFNRISTVMLNHVANTFLEEDPTIVKHLNKKYSK